MVHIIRDIRQHIEFVNSAVSTKLPRPTLSSQLTEWKEYIKRVVEPAQYMNLKKLERKIMEDNGLKVIHLTGAEKQSGYDRMNFAEDLIRQLPDNHEGRNTWLLNYSKREDAVRMRIEKGVEWNVYYQAAETIK
jgi:hypothetical protein